MFRFNVYKKPAFPNSKFHESILFGKPDKKSPDFIKWEITRFFSINKSLKPKSSSMLLTSINPLAPLQIE